MSLLQEACALCGEAASMRCTACGAAICSPECLKSRWPDHRAHCKKTQATRLGEDFAKASGERLLAAAGGTLITKLTSKKTSLNTSANQIARIRGELSELLKARHLTRYETAAVGILANVEISGRTPLGTAVQRRQRSSIRLLLEMKADPNASATLPLVAGGTEHPMSPLYLACGKDKVCAAIVSLLLEYRADPNLGVRVVAPGYGASDLGPVNEAARTGSRDCVAILMGARANIDDALHPAAISGNLGLVDDLVTIHFADVDSIDHEGRTLFASAAIVGHLDVCKYLLSARADPNMRDRNGLNALGLTKSSKSGLLKLLRKVCDKGYGLSERAIEHGCYIEETDGMLLLRRKLPGSERVISIDSQDGKMFSGGSGVAHIYFEGLDNKPTGKPSSVPFHQAVEMLIAFKEIKESLWP